jgi:hypothetical protein
MCSVQLFFSLDEFGLLFCKVYKLVKSFLVDVAVLLQFLIALVKFLEKLQKGNKIFTSNGLQSVLTISLTGLF